MNEGIYVFEDKDEFLKVIDEIAIFYQKDFQYLQKHFSHMSEVRNEIKFLNKCHIMSFSSFRKDSLIKVSFEDVKHDKFNITYHFKNSYRGTAFDNLHRYLRKRERNEDMRC